LVQTDHLSIVNCLHPKPDPTFTMGPSLAISQPPGWSAAFDSE
jgi:hypothetical protein